MGTHGKEGKMTDLLTVSFDYVSDDISALCVARHNNNGTITVVNMVLGEDAKRLYQELTERKEE